MNPKSLVLLVEEKTGVPSVGPVPLPSLSDVCYEPARQPLVSLRARGRYDGSKPLGTEPRPTGSVGKRCDNCRLWAEREEKCLILGREHQVPAGAVCGYHVGGEPQLYVTALSGEGSLTPEQAGLLLPGQIPQRGTTCDSCAYYTAMSDDSGTCRATADPSEPRCATRVDALGCCARWRAKVDPELPAAPPDDANAGR